MAGPERDASLPRIDARAKVTGRARYTGDLTVSGMVYAATVRSTIARGSVRKVDMRDALTAPGVIALFDHASFPRLMSDDGALNAKPGEKWIPLQTPDVFYAGQPVAMVIAGTLEEAEAAAQKIRIEYASPIAFADAAKNPYFPPTAIGEPLQSSRGSAPEGSVAVAARYTTPYESHNPMEPSASLAVWQGDQLTLYDTTQAVVATRKVVAHRLGVPEDHVRVVCDYVGGGFGCKGFVWHQGFLAAAAAREIGRPVKLVLTRSQMFTSVGYRAQTTQAIKLSAGPVGQLQTVQHDVATVTSLVDEFVESAGLLTRLLYASPALGVTHTVTPHALGTPGPMRAPGKASGSFALESAMDELAWKLDMDPLELRRINHADRDDAHALPWSAKNLLECYQRGAEQFGWDRRAPAPRATRDGDAWLGLGMATSVFPAYRSPAGARVRWTLEGVVEVASATQDLGTGTYTTMAAVVAEALQIPPQRVRSVLGDSALPPAPVSGGSQTTASVLPAVLAAVKALREGLIDLARTDPGSALFGSDPEQVSLREGSLFTGHASESVSALLSRHGLEFFERIANVDNQNGKTEYSFHSFGAQFVEVRVDEALGEIRVLRCLGVFDVGRVVNPLLAKSQLMGGMVWGIGMALTEETTYDPRFGRVMNDNLADYLVPTHADVPDLQVVCLDRPDFRINPLGAKGIGEIGIVGTAAAIANAVYHATGHRFRDLPLSRPRLMREFAAPRLN